MGQSTEELKRDIEYTRADMSETLDAIEDRMSPGRIVQRQKNRVTSSWHDIRDRVMGTASEWEHSVGGTASGMTDTVKEAPQAMMHKTEGSPMVAGAMAMGLGFLLAVAFPPTETERRAAESVADKVEPAKEQLVDSAKEVADHLKEPAKQAAQEVKETAREGASEVKSTARDAVQETKQQTSSSVSNVRDQ